MAEPIGDNQDKSIEEAVQQFVHARSHGQEPDTDEFVKQYPELEHQLRQRLQNLEKIDALFDSLVQADENDFEETASGQDLVGRKIGSFEIVEMIGRGGMGVVYLARDTKLDRLVAIKSIPIELQADSRARTRFTREAKMLASLSHPNIGVIHDIIEQTDGTDYLVLEYVPGETLAERITKGPLKLQEALTIALQIAEAAAAAHEHDVIHRDLKPGNIKITPDGRVKVLDFGLAKTVGGGPSEKPTAVTQPGRVIGTPAYMSPEQARGKPTDKRSDIWSFGCVLYEMLTGRVPFEGETISDMLAGILEREPDWQALPQSTPANIRSLLRHCLKKDPRRRLQHIGDARIEIDETLTSLTVSVPTVEEMRPVGLRRLMVWAVVCLLVGAIATSLVTWNLKRSAPLSQPTTRFIIPPETDLATDASFHHILALSPDGRRLAYVEEANDARRKIYLRELDKFKAKPLPGTEGAVSPFFSPDGQWIAYSDHYQRTFNKVSLKGGRPIVLCDSIQFRGGSWGTDDTIIFTPGLGAHEEGGLWRISASGEGLEQLTVSDPNKGERGHLWPQVLPGGKAVLFTNRCIGGPDIEVYSLETDRRTKLFSGHYARYVPTTGHIVYARTGALYAVRFDIERLKVVGSSVPIVPDVLTGGSGSAHFAISRNGSLAYVPVVTRSTELTPVWVDRNGRVETLPAATPHNYISVTISPDGTRLAFGIRDGDNRDVWIYDLTRHTLTPLTSDGISDYPIWTPDSKWAVFQSYQAGKFQLFMQNVTGSGEPELLAAFEGILGRLSCCSPDGKEVLVSRWDYYDPNHPRWGNDICVVLLEQNEKYHLRPFIQRNHNQRQGVWSPDGRWVAYAGDESGRWEVYVEPYPGPGPKTMISNQGGYQPAWSRNGKELFYRSGRGNRKMIAATFETEPEFRITGFEELFEGQYQRHIQWRNYDVAPDGRFLIIQEPQEPTPLGINVVLNWFEELKRLVPPGKD
ncbi:MAG: serine/threonine-protein kinase [Phycisphaerae bacterium]|nr:serine/threonine-protein kinase [Phycisphaerae bacterium]